MPEAYDLEDFETWPYGLYVCHCCDWSLVKLPEGVLEFLDWKEEQFEWVDAEDLYDGLFYRIGDA